MHLKESWLIVYNDIKFNPILDKNTNKKVKCVIRVQFLYINKKLDVLRAKIFHRRILFKEDLAILSSIHIAANPISYLLSCSKLIDKYPIFTVKGLTMKFDMKFRNPGLYQRFTNRDKRIYSNLLRPTAKF